MCKWSLLQGKAFIVHLRSGPDACYVHLLIIVVVVVVTNIINVIVIIIIIIIIIITTITIVTIVIVIVLWALRSPRAVFYTLVPHAQPHCICCVVFNEICFSFFLMHLRSGLLPQDAFIISHVESFAPVQPHRSHL